MSMPIPICFEPVQHLVQQPGAPLGFRLGLVRPRPVFQQRGQQVSHHRRDGGPSLSRSDSRQPVGFVVDRHADGLHRLPFTNLLSCVFIILSLI